jgi:alpha-D-xyloside xylohydrolase
MMHRYSCFCFLLILFSVRPSSSVEDSLTCGRNPANVISIQTNLAIAVCSSTTVRVVRGAEDAASIMAKRESLVIDPLSAKSEPFTDFEIESNDEGDIIGLKTKDMMLRVIYDEDSTNLEFLDDTGNYLFTRETQLGKATNVKDYEWLPMIQQSWTSVPGESLYGGGQYLNDFVDYKGAPLHMVQLNLEVVVPFFMSSRGYGILWDSYGETWLNPPDRLNRIALKASPSRGQSDNADSRVAYGEFSPQYSGDYWFSVDMQNEDYFNSNHHVAIALTESPTTDNRSITACNVHEINIPKVLTCKADGLKRFATYRVILNYDSVEMPRVFYKFNDAYSPTTLQTKDSKVVDYYLMVAEDHSTKLDSIIASYRKLTGSASLFSKKTYGFWQCKNHYHNQTDLLAAAKQHRALGIPIDNIVQDYMYWGSLGWGPHWDKTIYPDPKGMIQTLHDEFSLSFMVSVWSRFDNTTSFYKEMKANNYLMNGTQWFDAWNPSARSLFFQFLDKAHFSIGADAVWLDATEPEFDPHLNNTIYLGSGNEYRNTYSLEVTKSFYEGFAAKYKKRPFALTRSSFAGQHRFGSVMWTGDTVASFECLKRHIAMSLNYQMSGDPYWSMDIGGYRRPHDQYTSKDYQMLMLRWFQFGVFVPIMRAHGYSNTELWNYGNVTKSLVVKSALNLRYRLIPYIYSGFHRVEQSGYTMGRAMAFDFIDDPRARSISDQFMFGESFLVAPLYTLDSSRSYYLPSLAQGCCNSSTWHDFYTGRVMEPGLYHAQNVSPDATLLFVRSSIVVLAPKSQHVHDLAALKSLEVRIYCGKDSMFTLFEDDGVDPDPLRPSTTIKFEWSEKSLQLRIGKRQGKQYPGMPESRVIHIVLVRPNHGIGVDETLDADARVTYDGQELTVDLHEAYRYASGYRNTSNLVGTEDKSSGKVSS